MLPFFFAKEASFFCRMIVALKYAMFHFYLCSKWLRSMDLVPVTSSQSAAKSARSVQSSLLSDDLPDVDDTAVYSKYDDAIAMVDADVDTAVRSAASGAKSADSPGVGNGGVGVSVGCLLVFIVSLGKKMLIDEKHNAYCLQNALSLILSNVTCRNNYKTIFKELCQNLCL